MSKSSQADAARHRTEVISAASRLLRERGATGVSVQDAMAAAGLTHGGFYKHFRSKDDLLGAATTDAFGEILGLLDGLENDEDPKAARGRLFDSYLSLEHRDSPGAGCANTALATDAARAADSPLGAAYLDGLKNTIAHLENGDDAPNARQRALEQLIMLVGGLTLARATRGDSISEEFLSVARDALAS
ncbi:TetR/AcrR family transcriptional regulator [Agromyces binzhouensis]|uniref:TetR/AcrR family transcriptional regulator n=1 Tax=Agromyces binzhouensis TaxID=1817495 RepID=UPI0036354EC1